MEELLEKIDKKLAFIIGEKTREKYDTVKGQVKSVSFLTKDRNEIAFMLGISPSHAGKELTGLKKGGKNE